MRAGVGGGSGVGFGPQIKFGATDSEVGSGVGAGHGEIPAASAGMTDLWGAGCDGGGGAGVAGAGGCGRALEVVRGLALRRGLGLGPKSSLGRRIRRWGVALVLCSARYPRQARV